MASYAYMHIWVPANCSYPKAPTYQSNLAGIITFGKPATANTPANKFDTKKKNLEDNLKSKFYKYF